MKKLIIAVFAFFAFNASAQTQQAGSPSKISLGFTFSPDLGHQEIKYLDNGSVWLTNKTEEKVAFGFTAGPTVLLQLTNRFGFESGLLFADKAYRVKLVYNSSSENGPISGDGTYHAMFLDIPAKVNYYIINQKIKVYLSAGTAANFYLNQKNSVTHEYKDGSTVRTTSWGSTGAPAVGLSVLGGFGAGYAVNEKLQFRAGTLYRTMIPLHGEAPFRSRLISYGLELGAFLTL